MKLYVLINHDYDGSTIRGVYTERGLAELALERYADDSSIEEYEADQLPTLPAMSSWLCSWTGKQDDDIEATTPHPDPWALWRHSPESGRAWARDGVAYWQGFAPDADAAGRRLYETAAESLAEAEKAEFRQRDRAQYERVYGITIQDILIDSTNKLLERAFNAGTGDAS